MKHFIGLGIFLIAGCFSNAHAYSFGYPGIGFFPLCSDVNETNPINNVSANFNGKSEVIFLMIPRGFKSSTSGKYVADFVSVDQIEVFPPENIDVFLVVALKKMTVDEFYSNVFSIYKEHSDSFVRLDISQTRNNNTFMTKCWGKVAAINESDDDKYLLATDFRKD